MTTQQSQKLTWGDGIPGVAWDPQWGLRVYPRDDPSTGRHVDVLDPKWHNGQRPLWCSRSGLSGAALDAVTHPMTVELGTIRTDSARWEAHKKGHLAGWDLYLTHRHLDPQGQVLAVRRLAGRSQARNCEMVLVAVGELAAFLAGDREPEWLDGGPIEQVAYVYQGKDSLGNKVSVVAERVGTVGWVKWTRSEWLRALRAVYADYLSVGRIRCPADRIRRWPGLPIVGVAGFGYSAIYRVAGGMLVEHIMSEQGEDWQPYEDWMFNDGLFGHVLFSAPGRYLYSDRLGRLTWHPCGCRASGEEQAELLRHPDVAPAHDCERERGLREYNIALQREEDARLAAAVAEPAAEWEAELLAASGHADLI